jgi:hypothetical protein
MDSVTNWAGEHVANFSVDLFAALLAAWLFWKYQPAVSDFWSQRSVASLKNRLARLEQTLKTYKDDADDSALFLARA